MAVSLSSQRPSVTPAMAASYDPDDGSQPGATSPRADQPRKRSLRRDRPQRAWWLAVAIALVVNLGVVVALAQVSNLHVAAPQPPLAVRSLRQLDQEPTPPPPPVEERVSDEAPEAPEAIALALPSLDLPASSSTSDLRLPALASPALDLDLPLSIPAFTSIAPSVDVPVAAGGPGLDAPAFDTAAERQGAFDLDRFYPRTARLRGITGTSRVRIVIDVGGRVTAATVFDSAPPGVFEQAAERLCRGLRYRPAQAAGKPVASTQDITIEWTIR